MRNPAHTPAHRRARVFWFIFIRTGPVACRFFQSAHICAPPRTRKIESTARHLAPRIMDPHLALPPEITLEIANFALTGPNRYNTYGVICRLSRAWYDTLGATHLHIADPGSPAHAMRKLCRIMLIIRRGLPAHYSGIVTASDRNTSLTAVVACSGGHTPAHCSPIGDHYMHISKSHITGGSRGDYRAANAIQMWMAHENPEQFAVEYAWMCGRAHGRWRWERMPPHTVTCALPHIKPFAADFDGDEQPVFRAFGASAR